MTILLTYPEKENFHLFVECVENIYQESDWKIKKSEAVPRCYLNNCLVLIKNNKALARASIYLNPDLTYQNKKTACIGHYECINDIEVACFFHQQIEAYCKELQMEFIIGPMNGSTWENYRFNVQHYDALFFTEQLQADYYNDFFTDWGMSTISNYFSSKTKQLDFTFPGMKDLENYFKDLKVSIREIDLEKYALELEKLHTFLLEAFKTNFLFTPINKADFINKYLQYKAFIDRRFVLIAEDENQHIVGVIFCIQDIYNTQEKSLIIKTIARNSAKKWQGLGHLLGQKIYKLAHQQGFQSVVHAFIKEEGTSPKISKNFLGTSFKKYKLYGKDL